MYSQWRSAPNLVYPEEIPWSQVILPPRVFRKLFKALANPTTDEDLLSLLILEGLHPKTENRLEISAEVVFISIMIMITLRCKRNFENSSAHKRIIRDTRWITHLMPVQPDRRNAYRDNGYNIQFPLWRLHMDPENVEYYLQHLVAIFAGNDENEDINGNHNLDLVFDVEVPVGNNDE